MKRITVFIITYNQEDVIRRAMDSILSQRQWGLHRIIIGDDCSRDGTFGILQEYQRQYPDIVRPYRNEHNLGIYANLYHTIQCREDSDLFTVLSGDDALCEGYFQALQAFIDSRGIPMDEEIGIYGDWKAVMPDGKELCGLQDHSIVEKGYNLFSLHMRDLISNRSLMVTRPVVDKYQPPVLEKGLHLAEGLFDSQDTRIIRKAYHLPMVTSVYYWGIGVSKDLAETEYETTENIAKWEYYLEHFITDPRDVRYARYQIQRSRYLMKPGLGAYLKTLWLYFTSIHPLNLRVLRFGVHLALNLPKTARKK